MEAITKRLIDTAAILENLPKLLDLADERELELLAAIFRTYGESGGPIDYSERPGYLEDVLIGVLISQGRPKEIGTDNCDVVKYALTYAQRVPHSYADTALFRKALYLAAHPEDGSSDKPLSLEQALEKALSEKKREQHEAEVARAYENTPAGKRHRKAVESVDQIIKQTLAAKDRTMQQLERREPKARQRKAARKAASMLGVANA